MNKKYSSLINLLKITFFSFIWLAFISSAFARGYNGGSPQIEHRAPQAVKTALKTAKKKPQPKQEGPWFTGPLLAGGGHTVPAGHVNVEPYLFYTDDFGIFNATSKHTHAPNKHILNPTLVLTYGLTNWMDMEFIVPYSVNYRNQQNSLGFNDIGFVLGF